MISKICKSSTIWLEKLLFLSVLTGKRNANCKHEYIMKGFSLMSSHFFTKKHSVTFYWKLLQIVITKYLWVWVATATVFLNSVKYNHINMGKKCKHHLNKINPTYFSISIKILFCPHHIQMKIQKIVHCVPYYTTINLELVCCKKQKKTSSWLVTGLRNRGPLKILNGTKFILDDQGNHLDSNTISLESFKPFRVWLFCKPVLYRLY